MSENVIDQAKLANEEIDKIKKVIEETTSNEDNEFLDSLPSNNGVEEAPDVTIENPKEEKIEVEIDPVSGQYKQVAEELGISEEGARLLDLDLEDIMEIPESINDVEISDEILRKAILEDSNLKLNTEDTELLEQMIDLVKEYKTTPKMMKDNINWYNKLPNKIKEEVNRACAEVNNIDKGTKKIFAEYFLDQVIQSSGIDQISYDMQKSMNEAFDTDGIMSYIIEECKTQFEIGIENTMKKIKAIPEDKITDELRQQKIEQLEGIKHAYNQSYMLDEFTAAIKSGKVRVKKFDIEKWARHVHQWLYKYENTTSDTPFVIQDPTKCVPILYRIFNKRYTAEQCAALIIGFFKYTQNYNANDVVDHTFMSYFISNILQLDLIRKTSEQADFINILSNNLEEALKAINNIKDEESEEKDNE